MDVTKVHIVKILFPREFHQISSSDKDKKNFWLYFFNLFKSSDVILNQSKGLVSLSLKNQCQAFATSSAQIHIAHSLTPSCCLGLSSSETLSERPAQKAPSKKNHIHQKLSLSVPSPYFFFVLFLIYFTFLIYLTQLYLSFVWPPPPLRRSFPWEPWTLHIYFCSFTTESPGLRMVPGTKYLLSKHLIN